MVENMQPSAITNERRKRVRL
uniref:Uncharacterized protein n=1 Tax=Rhizophora mucronata TaxID=61149 RepID=A0A2P2QHX9_RHIMU